MNRKRTSLKSVDDAIGYVKTEVEQEAVSMKRRSMIEEVVFDEYTRATNRVDDTKRIAKGLSKLFK